MDSLELYRVSYSGRVRESLKSLLARARAVGRGSQVLQAILKLDRLLQIYPQFGDPLRDLSLEGAQLWIGVIPPLVSRYVIDEIHRQVLVVAPPQSLPRSGF